MAAINMIPEGTTVAAEKVGHHNIPVLGAEYPDEFPAKLGLEGRFYRSAEIAATFHEALATLPFDPDIILVFSGYDGHRDDQGGGVTDWTEPDYAAMTAEVVALSRRVSCPILSMHGGGYHLESAVSSAVAHVAVLAEGSW